MSAALRGPLQSEQLWNLGLFSVSPLCREQQDSVWASKVTALRAQSGAVGISELSHAACFRASDGPADSGSSSRSHEGQKESSGRAQGRPGSQQQELE